MVIVLAIPVFNDSISLKECLFYLDRLDPQPDYYLFLENNSIDDSLDVIMKWKEEHPNTIVIRLWFRSDSRYILSSPFGVIGIVRQIILDKVRRMDVDYLIFIDSDTLLGDTDFIKRITEYNLPLVGGAYYRRTINSNRYYLTSLTTYKDNKLPYVGLHRVIAISTGCMCINKDLIMDERVNFYPLIERRTGIISGETPLDSSEDFGYCMQAMDYGYGCFLDNSFNIVHSKNEYYRPWTRINGRYIDFVYPE